MSVAFHVDITGVVQGVGFRPYAVLLAEKHSLTGWILNNSAGVELIIEGQKNNIDHFMDELTSSPPAGSIIVNVDIRPESVRDFKDFKVLESRVEGKLALIPPDRATCDKCLKEMNKTSDRRYNYPFINCTACGPRFTIINSIPYDRAATSMKDFPLCPSCRADYDSTGDRRFHAEAIACPVCGPALNFTDRRGIEIPGDPLENAMEMIHGGRIVAIKGLGGFHLACRADNSDAVQRLRKRKNRPHRPLALMARDVETVRKIAEPSEKEISILTSPESPVVLMKSIKSSLVADNVDYPMTKRGIMLPYTPLHHQMMESDPGIIVMTSANTSGEPMLTDNNRALSELSEVADAFLMNNRDIVQPCDDSVVTSVKVPEALQINETPANHKESCSNENSFISADSSACLSNGETIIFHRRARGFAPLPVPVKQKLPPLLAAGADMKAVPALGEGHFIFPSQHIGDLSSDRVFERYESVIALLEASFRIKPSVVVHDMHPRYISTTFAKEYARSRELPCLEVQHHWAHILSVMAEHGTEEPVIGIALDGTGYGDDGTVWGGEILIADRNGYTREACLKPVDIPGGDIAMSQPWRSAAGYIYRDQPELLSRFLEDALLKNKNYQAEHQVTQAIHDGNQTIHDGNQANHDGNQTLHDSNQANHEDNRHQSAESAALLEIALKKGLNTYKTSSAGRLFDAVASLTGLCNSATYEGQAGMMLEAAAASIKAGRIKKDSESVYSFSIDEQMNFNDKKLLFMDTSPMISRIIEDVHDSRHVGEIAEHFHRTLVEMIAQTAVMISNRSGIKNIALSGGCFANTILLEGLYKNLTTRGYSVLINRRVPAGDGGIALGQGLAVNSLKG